MSWTQRLRIVWQGFFLVLFVWLLARLASGDPRALPFTVFHHADPLSAIGVVLADGTLPGALVWATLLLVVTVVFGRVFCGWVCPLGTIQQLSSWLLCLLGLGACVSRYRRWYTRPTHCRGLPRRSPYLHSG
jgi:polyferredoxin